MVQPTLLHHVNGGEPMAVNCRFCGASLEDVQERCAHHTKYGSVFFCKADSEHPENSCFLQWIRRQH